MSNYKFDLNEWLPRCPLEERSYGGFSGQTITGPCDICNNEHLRREMQDQFKCEPSVDVDVFVFAEGEPPDRFATKIGGLPYRPQEVPWPKVGDGTGMLSSKPYGSWGNVDTEEPMLFVGQLNFTNSKDITGELPGDILLVFAGDNFESVFLEWQPLGLTNLLSREDMHGVAGFESCYGHLCRTASYPQTEYVSNPSCRGVMVDCFYRLLQYQATQIGQAPFFVQECISDEPYRPLCTINSVHPAQHSRFPWVNREQPLMPEGQWSYSDRRLMIGDVGCIYIFMDDNRELLWAEACG